MSQKKLFPNPWTHALFDFDGTLVSTEEIAQAVIQESFVEMGVLNASSWSSAVIGRTWGAAAVMIHQLAQENGVPIPDIEQLRNSWKQKYRDSITRSAPLIPGAREWLQQVADRGVRMGIVTGSEGEEVSLILKQHGLEHFFDRIWPVGSYPEGKPSPAPYLQALADWKINPAGVLVFEDSSVGCESADRAGLSFVQILYGAYTVPHQKALKQVRNWFEMTGI